MIDIKVIRGWFNKPVEAMTESEIDELNQKIWTYSDPNGIKNKKASDYTDEDHVMRCIWCDVNWGRKTPDFDHYAKVIEKIHTMHKYIVLRDGQPYYYVDEGVQSLLIICGEQDWIKFLSLISEKSHDKYSLAECKITYSPFEGW